MGNVASDSRAGTGSCFDALPMSAAPPISNRKMTIARTAADAGVQALSSVPPVYYNYGQRGVMQYYEWLAKETELPVIIYASVQSGVTFTAANLAELVKCPGIRGLKFTSYNLYELMKMRVVRAFQADPFGPIRIFPAVEESVDG